MASKKYLLLAVFFCLLASTGFSQSVGSSYDVLDSSLIPGNRMPQHSEFLKGNYNFPAKPRNQWEVGIKGGLFQVSGDIPAIFISPGFGVHVRKAFGYIFSLRLEYMYGIGKGQHFQPAENFNKNTAWDGNGYFSPYRTNAGPIISTANRGTLVSQSPEIVYYNYKTKVQDLSLEGILVLNSIRFHKAKSNIVIYGIAGIGGTVYDTKINALDGDSKYRYQGTNFSMAYKDRRKTRDALKAMQDDTYETPAETHDIRRPSLLGGTFKPSATVGMGVAFKITKKISLAIEDRWTFVKDDLLDGQRWQEHSRGDATMTRDFDSYNFVSLGLNLNLGAKSVEPLWWLNPLDYVYGEVRNPRLMKIPKPVLPDGDDDGVPDQFDREPSTPTGCPVDSHGVTRDTDGDGVPDCKDKQLITPTECQPVDADGVGKCPVPCPDPEKCDCCKGVHHASCATGLGALPSIAFKAGTTNLDDDAKAALSTTAARMRNNPDCKVVVVGYCNSTKKEQQLSWDHVNTVINYMVDKEGISADRFFFKYGETGGDCNTVDLRPAADDESGDNRVDPPFPNLRKN